MQRLHQGVLITATLLGSWLGMQAIHEAGNSIAAFISGAHVKRVVLHPLTISRTDLGENPAPLFVVWAGPIFGVVAPAVFWLLAATARLQCSFVLRFFAGFCFIANGAYIAIGSFDRVGDCGVMLQHGSAMWQLWLFGGITIPAGIWLWHGQGQFFGLGSTPEAIRVGVAYSTLAAFLGLIIFALIVGGD